VFVQAHFVRPKEPMGEAWFMGEERRFFPELLGDLDSMQIEGTKMPATIGDLDSSRPCHS
jgi:hypothetical protein